MALVVGTNAYADAAYADAYFADSLRSADWTALSATVKDQALVTASRTLSVLFKEEYQLPIAPVDIPDQLKNGVSEYALSMALDPSLATQASTSGNTKRLKAGSAEIEYFNPQSSTKTRLPLFINELLAPYLKGSFDAAAIATLTPYASGTDAESSFTNRDKFGRTEGY